MRVGIDGLHLFGDYAGVKGSVASLVAALRRHFPSDEVYLYVPRDFKGPPEKNGDAGLVIRKTWFKGSWRTIRTIWRNFRLQPRIYRDRCDLMHGPVYALPGAVSKPAVVTIHDVIPFSHPLFCTPGSARVQKQSIPRSAKAARRIIVPSLATKEELLRYIKDVSAEKIDVIPWGVDERFAPLDDKARREEARRALSLPEQYVLFVGNIEPKKNLPLLIQAFFAARMNKKLPHKLVIAGQKGWKMDGLEKLIRELNAREYVLFTGYVPPAALPALYSLADLFVMPSVIEGFGMPVLEAMGCGCPVLVSSDAALQEVAGSAARVVKYDGQHPNQPLRQAIEEVLTD
ncbi:MAG TPA: glycosyltransferase family 1 protein, partial [Planctomycetota bacterium]|nr:glycosyltransferase family 1 protein [Planctomycetota bacterium]